MSASDIDNYLIVSYHLAYIDLTFNHYCINVLKSVSFIKEKQQTFAIFLHLQIQQIISVLKHKI